MQLVYVAHARRVRKRCSTLLEEQFASLVFGTFELSCRTLLMTDAAVAPYYISQPPKVEFDV